MTTLNIPIDEKVEKEAEELFSDFGLDIPTAVNIFLRQSIRENCIPFNIEREVPNADTIAAMREAEDMKKHPEKSQIRRTTRNKLVLKELFPKE